MAGEIAVSFIPLVHDVPAEGCTALIGTFPDLDEESLELAGPIPIGVVADGLIPTRAVARATRALACVSQAAT